MKAITKEEAAKLIKDNDTLAFSGFELACANEEVAIALEERFLETGSPKNLTVMHSSCWGDRKQKGMSHLSHKKLLKRWIGGIVKASSPALSEMIQNNECEAYNLPQGVLAQLYREIAAKRPGLITKIGLETYIDPRLEGGKMNEVTTEDLVQVIDLLDEEWMFYPSFPIQVGLIRGTYADEHGNLTLGKEGLHMEVLPIAQAVHNSGGIVIAQVEKIVKNETLNPKDVRVPGILIDYLVVSEPENHFQTGTTQFEPAFSGDVKIPLADVPPLPLDARKVIARRASTELKPDMVLNLGVGIPVNVSTVAAEENVSDQFILTTEAGTIGGIPAGLKDFGHAYNPEMIIDHHSQFDFYDGGGLDLSVLGLAEADQSGNVNVSKLGNQVIGCGGFINISQTAKKLVFTGTFTAGGLKTEVLNGALTILEEGRNKKFVQHVNQITFNGGFSAKNNQEVLFVTERAVFELNNGELVLIEIAPGIDLEKDILAQMEFPVKISADLKEMSAEIFQESWGKLAEIMEAKA
ncbi:acyl CoA:acetate/3-ketoacid CoA transferase [Enterococcus quebecensis]|uniref:Acyl CoA:acetate/3-ketoacid CoA transferase n=1 Tax=Enterococcus quebecensis TaxID=903983 RepID=A0A1E5GSW7_9ENTE|nr:acyl CoA:acetate/3-ketoacid CoA transferase [Enterococcus quebecensis]OEG15320.1 acyl CoA:acetate/3-ketoacid CoA transferase [Enterococcus quebecensis]OJG72283.1 coenzyme A transferase family protein [Enterococcus quebecensis]